MERGLIAALAVSAGWMLIHLLLMQCRPAENRFKAMTLCWLASLPAVPLLYALLPAQPGESFWMGLFLSGFFNLLLYFLFVECFYHIERAVTLRIMIEILKNAKGRTTIESIRKQYDVDGMIRRRLEVLQERQFIEQKDGAWRLKSKGRLFARTMQFSCWLFQCKGQKDRG